ncbi:MAG: hypothetical protein HY073_00350 [Deltaproteobacteria bacterium]|nr:hypothetical protein [Deltaproteobacteria bacterium]
MIFPYKKIGGLKYGPVAPLALKGVERWIPFDAFVDSGADYSVFHSDVAALIGLKLTSGEKRVVTVGDGDDMVVYVHKVLVRFADSIFKAPIAFSSALGSGFNLLGREAFFEKFQVCFNDKDQVLRTTKL